MRAAKVLYKREEAGRLIQHDDGSFTYRYHDFWVVDHNKPSISLLLPKSIQEHHSPYLFSFFFNMLPEGINKQIACRSLKIDEDDYFGLLMATAKHDTIGAVTISESV